MSVNCRLLLLPCVAVLLSIAACGRQTTGVAHATPIPASASTTDKAATQPTPPPQAPPPSTDQRLAQALDHLGAKHGPRGEVLTVSDESLGARGTKVQSGVASELEQVATVLRDYPKADVVIDGYTDNRGSERGNDRRSLKRAEEVKRALTKDGLDASRMSTRGLGPADPIGDNHTRAGREQNRRVELVFSDSTGRFATVEGQHTSG